MTNPQLFWGRESFLSNFHPVVFRDETNGYRYTSSEQYYMREKALHHKCFVAAAKIKNTHNPYLIKKIGRKLPRTDEWYVNMAIPVMYRALYYKFNQNIHLKKKLLQTGDRILAEASPFDDFWGIKCVSNDPDAYNPARWKGQNYLGLLLMYLRKQLRESTESINNIPSITTLQEIIL